MPAMRLVPNNLGGLGEGSLLEVPGGAAGAAVVEGAAGRAVARARLRLRTLTVRVRAVAFQDRNVLPVLEVVGCNEKLHIFSSKRQYSKTFLHLLK